MPDDPSLGEVTESHRWHAIECNNLAWQLSDLPGRSPSQDDEMLNAAHASAFHWDTVGPELNKARARMLLARVHAALGLGQSALVYAHQSQDNLSAHESPDWEIAFAHAILSHAAYAAGEAELHRKHHGIAKELGIKVADPEDRDMFFEAFCSIPVPQALGG